MGTYASWLSQQDSRQDAVGEAARWWASFEGRRPRMSSPESIMKWLKDHDRPTWDNGGKERWYAAVEEFKSQQQPRHLAAVPDPATVMTDLGTIMTKLNHLDAKLETIMLHLGIGTDLRADLQKTITVTAPLTAESLQNVAQAAGMTPGELEKAQREAYEQLKTQVMADGDVSHLLWGALHEAARFDEESG